MNSVSEAWDVTIEVMNQCAGSCTGCALTLEERRQASPVISLAEFGIAMERLARHGSKNGMLFRPVLVFGDIPLMPYPMLKGYLDTCVRNELPVGLTLTLASEGQDDHYDESLEMILSNGDVVLDLTIDPFRLAAKEGYARRVSNVLASNDHNHVQVLLSEVMLNRVIPEDLAARLESIIGEHPVSIVFTPTQANLLRRQYQFDVRDAVRFALSFYATRPWHQAHYIREMKRMTCAQGDYASFVGQAFHIGRGLDLYASIFTPFGDLILDGRNGMGPVGNLCDDSLEEILKSPKLLAMQARNAGWLRHDVYGCGTCEHYEVCGFHGVGLANKLYSGHDSKVGTCYGPRAFMSEEATRV